MVSPTMGNDSHVPDVGDLVHKDADLSVSVSQVHLIGLWIVYYVKYLFDGEAVEN